MAPRGLRPVTNVIVRVARGIAAALRTRWKVFPAVALGVFALNLFLPVVVLSLARKPVDPFTLNPWLSRLPEWLASGKVPISRKLECLPTLALAWFSAESANPFVGREWGFVVDVSSLVRFISYSRLSSSERISLSGSAGEIRRGSADGGRARVGAAEWWAR